MQRIVLVPTRFYTIFRKRGQKIATLLYMNNSDKYFKTNKILWNERVAVHEASKFYNVEGFKAGETSLKGVELAEVGEVKGKKLLHLQCHFGMDTLSWARLGAEATGVDFSDNAIELARQLSDELNIPARFVCANIYDLPQHLHEKAAFDIVFTSYGTIGWLPDLDKWAAVVAHFLKPGGIFYIVDFHPVMWMFNGSFTHVSYSYFNEGVIAEQVQGTYADRNALLEHTEYGWNHSLGEIINALLNQGLQLQFLNEFPFSPFNILQDMKQDKDGNWHLRRQNDRIPLLFSIKATKPVQ